MYLHRITIRNYSIHRETEINLWPITVLVGPNGSGKSSFFDALLNFSMLSRGKIEQAFDYYPYSFEATKHHGTHPLDRIGFEVLLSETQNSSPQFQYSIDYLQLDKANVEQPVFDIQSESLQSLPDRNLLFDRQKIGTSALKEAIPFVGRDTGILAAVRQSAIRNQSSKLPASLIECAKDIGRFNKFRLDPHELSLPSSLPDLSSLEPPRIEYDGKNLAGCLYFMHQKGDSILAIISEQIKKAIPEFEEFQFNLVRGNRIGFSVKFSDQRQLMSAARLSDGQRLFIGLMVLIYSANRPPVLMIEEPETGLTPTAQRIFYQAIRNLALKDNEKLRSQILISSHSPFIICEAWNGEDRDFIHQVKVEDGSAVVRKFSDAVKKAGIQLSRDKDRDRSRLGLSNAEDLMSGHLSQA